MAHEPRLRLKQQTPQDLIHEALGSLVSYSPPESGWDVNIPIHLLSTFVFTPIWVSCTVTAEVRLSRQFYYDPADRTNTGRGGVESRVAWEPNGLPDVRVGLAPAVDSEAWLYRCETEWWVVKTPAAYIEFPWLVIKIPAFVVLTLEALDAVWGRFNPTLVNPFEARLAVLYSMGGLRCMVARAQDVLDLPEGRIDRSTRSRLYTLRACDLLPSLFSPEDVDFLRNDRKSSSDFTPR